MDKFPLQIAQGMHDSGAMITCVPVQFDNGEWESAVFFEVGGKQSREDRRVLRKIKTALPVTLEGEVISHANGSIVMLRFEVLTNKSNPLVGEVLLAPGLGNTQFDTLKLLSEQRQLRWYFGDANYSVIHSQQTTLFDHERQGYADLLSEAVTHDALLRVTGKYNATSAIEEVCSNYAFRQD
jgi:hypothetical protein